MERPCRHSICDHVQSSFLNLETCISKELLLTAYYGLVIPHLSYGIPMSGAWSKQDFKRFFIPQESSSCNCRSDETIESCWETFREFGILELPYSVDSTLDPHPADVFTAITPGQKTCWVIPNGQHHLQCSERLPSQTCVRILNKITEDIKSNATVPKFKASHRFLLASMAVYLVDYWYVS